MRHGFAHSFATSKRMIRTLYLSPGLSFRIHKSITAGAPRSTLVTSISNRRRGDIFRGYSTYKNRRTEWHRSAENAMPQQPEKGGCGKTFSNIQFITTPTADTPGTALLLHFNDKRYIVGNVHEGLQRAGLQRGPRFLKAKEFLLTGKTEWSSNGGLMGMILTLADSANSSARSRADNTKMKNERQIAREEEQARTQSTKRKKNSTAAESGAKLAEPQAIEEDTTVTLHGGPNLTHTIATARSFIFRHGTPIKVIEHHEEGQSPREDNGWGPTWKDDLIQVWSMAISPSKNETMNETKSPRKRSLDEFIIGQSQSSAQLTKHGSPQSSEPLDEERRKQKIRENVVNEMFNSTWKFDNLVETPLHQVHLPAALFTRDPKSNKLVKYIGPLPDGTKAISNINVLVRQPWPGALVDNLPPATPSSIAMSYIIRNHKQRGKFKPEAAENLKVPKGKLWARLARGIEVQSADGKTITPDMVLEPGKEGSGIAVIDLPSKEYVPELIGRPEWNAEKVMAGVGAIVWILGQGVIHDAALRAFMEQKSTLKHIVSSVDYCPNYLTQTSAAAAAIRHHQIDPTRFPVPVHSNALPAQEGQTREESKKMPQYHLQADRGLRIDLEPSFRIADEEVVPLLNTALIVKETPKDVITLGQAASKAITTQASQEEAAKQNLPSPDAEIITLGTGSASPSIFRNVSATLLRVPGYGSYLIDCGENTLGQLRRVFTESQLAEVLQDLKLIWISHLHADHHLGTASVIKAWYEEVHGKDPTKRRRPSLTESFLDPAKYLEGGQRLFIVGHRQMMRWLEEYSSVEDFGYDQLVPITSSGAPRHRRNSYPLSWNGINVDYTTADNPQV